MTLKKQFTKIKDNWLLILLPLVLLFLFMFLSGGSSSFNLSKSTGIAGYAADEDYAGRGAYPSSVPWPGYPSNIAPEVKERMITKSASLSVETEKGTFKQADERLRSIVQSSESILLNENMHANDQGWKTYSQASYVIKVDTAKYESVVTQLKTLGEVTGFSESSDDITGQYTDLNVELAAERAKLARYNDLYRQNLTASERVALIPTIFDQERRISYLEDQIKNSGQRVAYSTVTLSLSEKRSEYSDIAFARLSDLVKAFVASINSVLYLFASIIPYAVVLWLVWLIYKKARD